MGRRSGPQTTQAASGRPVSSVVALLATINGPLSRAGRNAAGLLLAVMLGLAIVQIAMRGLLDVSLDWAEELARFALVWSALLTAPYAYRHGAHVAIVSFAMSLPPRPRVVAGILLNLVVVWVLGVLLRESIVLWQRGLALVAASLPISMAWIYVVVPVSLAALVLVGVELLLRLVLHLRGQPSGIVLEGAMPAVAED